MNSTRKHRKNSGYLVILLLVVGLTAFSHSMKELTEIHELTLDTSRLVAQWSGNISPAEIPPAVVKIEKRESCYIKQSAPSVELPWLNETPTEPSAVAPGKIRQNSTGKIQTRSINLPIETQIAKLKKLQRFDIDADAFEFSVPSVQFAEAGTPGALDMPEFTFKTKARKHGAIRINPRDREMFLKTLNRSLNLRIAS